jgi:hypothetical protein
MFLPPVNMFLIGWILYRLAKLTQNGDLPVRLRNWRKSVLPVWPQNWRKTGIYLFGFECCETAGFSWVLQNELVERVSLNECILNAGHGLYTWQSRTIHRQRKWRFDLHKGALSRRINFKWGTRQPYLTRVRFLTSRLVYIYSVRKWRKMGVYRFGCKTDAKWWFTCLVEKLT